MSGEISKVSGFGNNKYAKEEKQNKKQKEDDKNKKSANDDDIVNLSNKKKSNVTYNYGLAPKLNKHIIKSTNKPKL